MVFAEDQKPYRLKTSRQIVLACENKLSCLLFRIVFSLSAGVFLTSVRTRAEIRSRFFSEPMTLSEAEEGGGGDLSCLTLKTNSGDDDHNYGCRILLMMGKTRVNKYCARSLQKDHLSGGGFYDCHLLVREGYGIPKEFLREIRLEGESPLGQSVNCPSLLRDDERDGGGFPGTEVRSIGSLSVGMSARIYL